MSIYTEGARLSHLKLGNVIYLAPIMLKNEIVGHSVFVSETSEVECVNDFDLTIRKPKFYDLQGAGSENVTDKVWEVIKEVTKESKGVTININIG